MSRINYRLLILFAVLASMIVTGLSIGGRHDSGEGALLTFSINLHNGSDVLIDPAEIKIDGVIENRSEADIIINTRFAFPGPDVYLTVKRADGEILRWLPPGVPRPPAKEDFEILRSGQQIGFALVLRQNDLYDKMTPGEYTAEARYVNTSGDEFGLRAWKGTLYSNTIAFRYDEPLNS